MHVGILGINHKLANLQLREQLARTCQRRFGAGNSLHSKHNFVLLSTCNRTEIYFSSECLADTHSYILTILRQDVPEEFDQKLYSYFGTDCFLHLCRVITGLDSAIVGETEIQGQVKTAYEYATSYFYLPADMHYLFQKAFMVGKRVRSEFPLQRGLPDLEHAIFHMGSRLFENLQETKILFVGASNINHKLLSFLKRKHVPNITLCNRSLETAQKLAKTYAIPILEWSHISNWPDFDWIIFGTKSNGYIATKEHASSQCIGRKLVVDLSVPRNVDPRLGQNPKISLLNIDQINKTLSIRHKQMNHVLQQAQALICSSLERLLKANRARPETLDQKRKVAT